MKIAIRMDDITPDMDYAKFDRFKALLEEYGITALLGIVPENHDPKLHIEPEHADFWDEMHVLERKGWGLAMHGLHHVYTTGKGGLLPLNHQSEYAGLSYETQENMIREGKEILKSHGITTALFMAPAHSYDGNTLRALAANGFTGMTDGFGQKPYRWKGICFYPISFSKSRSLASAKEGVVTFVVHANTMTEQEFAFYKMLLGTGKVISFNELIKTQAAAGNAVHRASEWVMASAKYAAREILSKRRKKA